MSLLESYESIVSQIESKSNLSLTDIINHLEETYKHRQFEKSEKEFKSHADQMALNMNTKGGIICHFCGKSGQIKRDCIAFKQTDVFPRK